MYVSASVCVCVCSMFARNFSVNHKKCKPKMKKFILNNLKMRERYRVHLFLPKLIYANRILPVVIHKTRHFIAFTCVIACHSHKISINISPSGRCVCVCVRIQKFLKTLEAVYRKKLIKLSQFIALVKIFGILNNQNFTSALYRIDFPIYFTNWHQFIGISHQIDTAMN